MLRVLVVDSNDDRREALTNQITELGLTVSTMSLISLHNYQNTLVYNDIIVLLDQCQELVSQVLKVTDMQQVKKVMSNQIQPQMNKDKFLYLTRIEEEVVKHIRLLIAQHNDPRLVPIAEDPRSRATLEVARKAAKTNATVLISGETGVGKEVLAHFIHHQSASQLGPFVSVNCAALPENMIEAILFGYEKGAFTSAINSYMGKFEQAQNGTLLLDEISEISLSLQAKLLRVLQEREVERLGGKKTIYINARIIAATNRDLQQQVAAGEFRKDLYYRLNVLPIHCAALRERPLDIVPMATFLIAHHAKLLNRNVPSLTEAAKRKLSEYTWPGNIREMENVVQRALIMTENDVIDDEDFYLVENPTVNADNGVVIDMGQFNSKLQASEARVIMDVLQEVNGCRNSAARKLNISPRTLRYKIAKLRSIGLKVPKGNKEVL